MLYFILFHKCRPWLGLLYYCRWNSFLRLYPFYPKYFSFEVPDSDHIRSQGRLHFLGPLICGINADIAQLSLHHELESAILQMVDNNGNYTNSYILW